MPYRERHAGLLHRHTSMVYAYRRSHTAITKNQENNKPLRARRKKSICFLVTLTYFQYIRFYFRIKIYYLYFG